MIRTHSLTLTEEFIRNKLVYGRVSSSRPVKRLMVNKLTVYKSQSVNIIIITSSALALFWLLIVNIKTQ